MSPPSHVWGRSSDSAAVAPLLPCPCFLSLVALEGAIHAARNLPPCVLVLLLLRLVATRARLLRGKKWPASPSAWLPLHPSPSQWTLDERQRPGEKEAFHHRHRHHCQHRRHLAPLLFLLCPAAAAAADRLGFDSLHHVAAASAADVAVSVDFLGLLDSVCCWRWW